MDDQEIKKLLECMNYCYHRFNEHPEKTTGIAKNSKLGLFINYMIVNLEKLK